jgi:hypothetical protein
MLAIPTPILTLSLQTLTPSLPKSAHGLPFGLQSLLCILLLLESDFFHLTCRLIIFVVAIAANRAHIVVII